MYYSVDILNSLKEMEMGSSKNRYEWIKTLKVCPLEFHLIVDQEKSCRYVLSVYISCHILQSICYEVE